MIDLKLLRDDLESVRAAYSKRGGVEGLDRIGELDREYRDLLVRVEQMRAEHNRSSKAIGIATPEDRPAAIAAAKELADAIKGAEPELERLETELEEAAAYLPNIPHESVPSGLSEDENVVEREVGDKPAFDFEPLDHVDLGERLGLFDNERAARTSGSRFVYLTGRGAILELALVRFAVDFLYSRGFEPVDPSRSSARTCDVRHGLPTGRRARVLP